MRLQSVKVPTPSLARENCRWCHLLEEDTHQPHQPVTRESSYYEPVELLRVELRQNSDILERRIYREEREMEEKRREESYREKRERRNYREETYGEVREREGRRRERPQEDDWRGRSPGRRWRGRSSSRIPTESREGEGWRGRHSDREWRGRSPGLGGDCW